MATLKASVASLENKISDLADHLRAKATDTPVKSKIVDGINVSDVSSQLPSCNTISGSSISGTSNSVLPNGILPSEHRFNVILYGVKESPPDISRYQRRKSDLEESVAILSTLNGEINSYSVRD